MRTLARAYRRHARDLPRPLRSPLGGLLAAAGAGILAFLGVKRYRQPKVGDTVLVQTGLFSATGAQGPEDTTIAAKVLAVGPAPSTGLLRQVSPGQPSVTVAPIVGGVQSPAGVTIPPNFVLQNLTPHL